MAEALVVESTDLGVGAGDDHRTLVVEQLPELAEAGPVGRTLDHQAVALVGLLALGRDRTLALGDALLDLLA